MPRPPFPRTLLALLPIVAALLAALAGHRDWPILLTAIAIAFAACSAFVIYSSVPKRQHQHASYEEPAAAPVVPQEAAAEAVIPAVEIAPVEPAAPETTTEITQPPLPEAETCGTRAEALATGHWRETDLLTGLLNAGTFLVRLTEILARCRSANQTAILIVCDIDAFGEINRTAGLVEANCLLRQVADCFRLTVREGDLLSRLGGDEFGLFFPGLPPEIAETRARDLRAAVREAGLLTLPEGSAQVTACLGIGCFPADADSVDALLAAAESSLARAKRERQEAANRPVPSAIVIKRNDSPHPPQLRPDNLA